MARLLLPVLLLALLSACGPMPSLLGPSASERLQASAASLEAAGDFQGAAQLYLDEAARSAPPAQYSLQLQAADILVRGKLFAPAHALLDRLQALGLQGDVQDQLTLRRARLALAEQHPDDALALLQTAPAASGALEDFHRLRARAYEANAQYFTAAQERVQLDVLLSASAARSANERALWDDLNQLSDSDLQQLRKAPPPDPLSGWMELVELTRLYLQQPDALAAVIPQWQQRYPAHPASLQFVGELLEHMRSAAQAPEHVAILLPAGGELAAAAAAVRDGIIAAYYDAPLNSVRPTLRLYDCGDTEQQTLDSYRQAAGAGASFVIGPLRKEMVEVLARQPELPVPVLALNRVEAGTTTSNNLYQFGLAPEDEAREAARLAWHNGLTRAVALLPDTDWGERVFAAFAAEWQLLGGTLLEAQRYDDTTTDHSNAITRLLNLDSSTAREQRLTRLLGTRLAFEPRRRQDVDFVFLVASPRQARLIRPQLSFFHATALPVYATSRVYTGTPDPVRDSDMNGIVFCDTPWTLTDHGSWSSLQKAIAAAWPDSSKRYARLYALGIDAYRILPYLGRQQNNLFGSYHGVSGNLTIGNQGVIDRTLRCARFEKGVPVLLETDPVPAPGTPPAH
jgi:outer membrane PBP1 activator LpoA protein